MTTAQQGAISSPDAALFVYNTDTNQYEFYNGTMWSGFGGASYWSRTGSILAPTTVGDTVQVGDGTSAIPSYSFVSDVFSGIGYQTTSQFQLISGGVAGISIKNAPGMTHEAAVDTAGQSIWMQTANAGSGATSPLLGGSFDIRAGAGSAGSGGVAGGVGGSMMTRAGDGGNSTGTGNGGNGGTGSLSGSTGGSNTGAAATGDGGNGGPCQLNPGGGGHTNSTGTGNGGAAGGTDITAANGGNATAGTGNGGAGSGYLWAGGSGGTSVGGTGGAGGTYTVSPGLGGTGATAGAQGRFKIAGSGIFAFANAQSITPSATTTLILTATAAANQVVVASTFIKVASDAAGRKILLPTEASSNGLFLIFANTSATNTMVLRDSTDASTIATLAVSSQQMVMCDGTTWFPIAANSTPVSNYWQRTGTVLTPATAGDDVSSPRAAAGSFNEVFGSGAAITGTAAGITMLGYGAGFSGSAIGNSVVIGTSAVVSSTGAYEITAIGRSVNISGAGNVGATVVGYAPQMTTANCYYATGFGHGITLSSPYVVAVGPASAIGASSDFSCVFGYGATSNALSVISLGAGAQCSTANRCLIGGGAVGGTSGNITSIVVGNGETNATPVGFSMMPTQASGSDKAGSDFTVRGGRNTGSGAGGQFLIDVYPAGASSSTGGTATNMHRVTSTYYSERRAGSGSGFANMAGGLFAAYTDTTSSGTSAQNLHSFTLIGNTLLHDGDTIEFYSTMALTTLGGNLTVAFRLGSTDLTMFNAAAPAGATQATYRVRCIRTGAATQRVEGTITINATTPYTNTVYTTMAETLANNLTIANRVTATVSGTITNQITTVMYEPAPQT